MHMVQALESFVNLFRSFIVYEQMVFRLIWRGGLTSDFASVMAVEGQMRRKEVRCLYELAQTAAREGVIVEIGSYRGLSTVALAKGSLRGHKIPVYAIDPHEYVDPGICTGRSGWCYDPQDNVAFLKNILFAGVAEKVRLINLLSFEAVAGWDKPISLLYIDGNHEYEAAERDFSEWSRFVLNGGHVVFHDSIDPYGGPYSAVQGALQKDFILLKQVEIVSVLQKR